jgi:hypothetical protein
MKGCTTMSNPSSSTTQDSFSAEVRGSFPARPAAGAPAILSFPLSAHDLAACRGLPTELHEAVMLVAGAVAAAKQLASEASGFLEALHPAVPGSEKDEWFARVALHASVLANLRAAIAEQDGKAAAAFSRARGLAPFRFNETSFVSAYAAACALTEPATELLHALAEGGRGNLVRVRSGDWRTVTYGREFPRPPRWLARGWERWLRRLDGLQTVVLGEALNSSAPQGADGASLRPSRPAPARPQQPTKEYCLIPPNVVRWEGQVEIEPRLWQLLKLLLVRLALPGTAVSIEDAEDLLGKVRRSKAMSNDVSELNQQLETIKFPWTFGTKSSHIFRHP